MSLSQLERAKFFYDEGLFAKAAEACLTLHAEGSETFESHLLFTKSYLFMMGSPVKAENNKNFCSSAQRVIAHATTVQEYFTAQNELTALFSSWLLRTSMDVVAKLTEKPSEFSFDRWQSVLDLIKICLDFDFLFKFSIQNEKHLSELCTAENTTPDEAKNQFSQPQKESAYDLVNTAIKDYLFEFISRRAVSTNNLVEQTRTLNTDAVRIFAKKAINEFYLAESIVSFCTPEAKAGSEEIRLERLLKHAEICTDFLNAVTYANGTPISLLTSANDRMTQRTKLKDLYEEIQKIDSSISMPVLPDMNPTLPKTVSRPSAPTTSSTPSRPSAPPTLSTSSYSNSSSGTSTPPTLSASSYSKPSSSGTSTPPTLSAASYSKPSSGTSTPPTLSASSYSKPSSSGTSSNSGGCYVATAVYGSYDCPEVWTLRRFRDYTLAETWYGRVFIRTYYAISPTLVKWFGKTEWFKNLWKPTLDRMVSNLNKNGVNDTPYNDRTW